MVNLDTYQAVGCALELLANSAYHRRFGVGNYLRTEIYPPLRLGFCRYYLNDSDAPSALVTWAWLSESVEQDIHQSGRALRHDEWQSGDRLFFNDWITPFGNLREVVGDMTRVHFPNEVASSLRRNPDGSVKRVNRWTGANVRRANAEGPA